MVTWSRRGPPHPVKSYYGGFEESGSGLTYDTVAEAEAAAADRNGSERTSSYGAASEGGESEETEGVFRGSGDRRESVPSRGGAGAASVRSLQDLLEALQFDGNSGEDAPHGESGIPIFESSGDIFSETSGMFGSFGESARGVSGPVQEEDEEGNAKTNDADAEGNVGSIEEDEEDTFVGEKRRPQSSAPPTGSNHGNHGKETSHADTYYDEDDDMANTPKYRNSQPLHADDEGSDCSEDDDDDSLKSYEDAGYDNEEDYLFDQYGGIGGTSEERAELAEALMHTLNVGPMADELFYEEVAMCFLRCRERHRMRMRREKQRERKRQKRRESKMRKKKQHAKAEGTASRSPKGRAGEGDGDADGVTLGMSDMSMSNSTSFFEKQRTDHTDEDSVDGMTEQMNNVNVESDYEDVRESRRRRGGDGDGDEEDNDDEEDNVEDGSGDNDSLPSPFSSDQGNEEDADEGDNDYFFDLSPLKGKKPPAPTSDEPASGSEEDELERARQMGIFSVGPDGLSHSFKPEDLSKVLEGLDGIYDYEDDEEKPKAEAAMEHDDDEETSPGKNSRVPRHAVGDGTKMATLQAMVATLTTSMAALIKDKGNGRSKRKPKTSTTDPVVPRLHLHDQTNPPTGTSKCPNCGMFVYHKPDKSSS